MVTLSLVSLHQASLIVILFCSQANQSAIFACCQKIVRLHTNRIMVCVCSSLFSKVLAALGRLTASIPLHALSIRAADQATLHAAFCNALQVWFILSAAGSFFVTLFCRATSTRYILPLPLTTRFASVRLMLSCTYALHAQQL